MKPEKEFWVLLLATVSLLILTVYLSVEAHAGAWPIVTGILCFTALTMTLALRFDSGKDSASIDQSDFESQCEAESMRTIPFGPRPMDK